MKYLNMIIYYKIRQGLVAVLLAGSNWVRLLLVHGLESRESFYSVFLLYKWYNTNSFNTIRTVRIVYKLYYKFVHGVVFVQIHTNKFLQLLYKLYSTNSYTVWFLYEFIQFLYQL